MKKIQFLIIALLCGAFTACMDFEWDEHQPTGSESGNPYVQDTNVVTIAALKQQYASAIEGGSYKQVDKTMEVKGIVIGNDVSGNIYQQVIIDDGTGALVLSIAQAALSGVLPVGQEVLVELNGLCVGGYGKQPQVGTPYTNSNGTLGLGRMSRFTWQGHHRLLEKKTPIAPIDFDVTKMTNSDYKKDFCGKLMTIRNVRFAGADGTAVYAGEKDPQTGGAVNKQLVGYNSNQLVVRTSTYAKFANKVLPQEAVDITGIFSRFSDTWQILIRDVDDVVPHVDTTNN
ncbi:MAG: hypothetical protein IKQ05_01900 [Prevotella sp.]|jgi:hypothetical protein|nr:hypothetical protein [Prevotella sp.]